MIKITLFSTPLKYCDTSSKETGRPFSHLCFLHPYRMQLSPDNQGLDRKIYKSKQGKLLFQPIMSISAPKGPFFHGNKQVANCKTSWEICLFYLLEEPVTNTSGCWPCPLGRHETPLYPWTAGLSGSSLSFQNPKLQRLWSAPQHALRAQTSDRALLISQWGHGRSSWAHGSQMRHFPFPSS